MDQPLETMREAARALRGEINREEELEAGHDVLQEPLYTDIDEWFSFMESNE